VRGPKTSPRKRGQYLGVCFTSPRDESNSARLSPTHDQARRTPLLSAWSDMACSVTTGVDGYQIHQEPGAQEPMVDAVFTQVRRRSTGACAHAAGETDA
jgi:hypothetical protein